MGELRPRRGRPQPGDGVGGLPRGGCPLSANDTAAASCQASEAGEAGFPAAASGAR
nr:hypothetical protein [Pseudonocardia sp. AL041005-10]